MKLRCALALCMAGAALVATAGAQHSDIVLQLDGNQLVTFNGVTGEAARIFTGELGEQSVPGWTDDPGYASSVLAGSSRVGFEVVDVLYYWDGTQFTLPPANESMDIDYAGVLHVNVSGTTVPDPTGFDFAVADSSGHVHAHVEYLVRYEDYDPGDPFTNPISDGAYVMLEQVTSSVHDNSRTYAIVFNQNLSSDDFEFAAAATQDLICSGDLDQNNSVDLADLQILLSNYGSMGEALYYDGDVTFDGNVDLADLQKLLSQYGTICE